MTDKQLEKIGLRASRKTCPNNQKSYWSDIAHVYLTILPSDTLTEIIKAIYHEGFIRGIKSGKKSRSQDFKDLLNNEDL